MQRFQTCRDMAQIKNQFSVCNNSHIPALLHYVQKMKATLFSFICLCPFAISAQESPNDSISNKILDEVNIESKRSTKDVARKPLTSLEGFLEGNKSINLVRRGAYAWEPFLNGMSSERSVITIDGMRIYGACTDKMDPVTSYVEISNLSKASIHSGQSSSVGGSSIAGNLDLVRRKGNFGEKNFKSSVFSGLETNNMHKILGTSIAFSSPKFFSDFDLSFRDAGNYRAGGNQEILNSQFTKYNTSAILGYKINAHQELEASVIYDIATDIGYPALPMDVSLARAIIGSLEYSRHHISHHVKLWKTKIYYNHVKHIMDDSHRPDVPIRMDMPGLSSTAGFYSFVQGKSGSHLWKSTLSGHHNNSYAEMTMYPANPNSSPMFMLTWPDVNTNYIDFFIEDYIPLTSKLKSLFSMGIALHNNTIQNELGINSLRIFYPQFQDSKNRLLKRLSGTLLYEPGRWNISLSLEYGERAPSVSEGYGFYLFNSFDKYDYIGNPEMKNEKSANVSGKIAYKSNRFSCKLNSSFFYLSDYIIGIPDSSLVPMTLAANGIRVYTQIQHAQIFNSSIECSYLFHKNWAWTSSLSYRKGVGATIGNLPLIQPFSYSSEIRFATKTFDIEAKFSGAASNKSFNPNFGETSVKPYSLFDISASKHYKWKNQRLNIKIGAENIFDVKYTTFSDWNRIPRPGRNFYVNLIWEI